MTKGSLTGSLIVNRQSSSTLTLRALLYLALVLSGRQEDEEESKNHSSFWGTLILTLWVALVAKQERPYIASVPSNQLILIKLIRPRHMSRDHLSTTGTIDDAASSPTATSTANYCT